MAIESVVGDPPAHRPRRRIAVLVVALLAVALVVTAAALPFSLYRQIGETDISLKSLPDRPIVTDIAAGSLNVAVLGTADGLCVSALVFHIGASRMDASFVSVPGTRACGVDPAPTTPETIRSVAQKLEKQSGIRFDHLAVLDWDAIRDLDGLAGGVQLDLSGLGIEGRAAYPIVTEDETLQLVYYPIANDLEERGRIARQQALLQEVLRATLHQEMRKDPTQVYSFLDTVTRNLAVDEDWSWIDLTRLAISLRNMRSNDITFHVAPTYNGAQSTADDPLWDSVREDRLNGG